MTARVVRIVTLVWILAPGSVEAVQDTLITRDTVTAPAAPVAPIQADTPATRHVPMLEPDVPVGPLAPGRRMTFTREALQWSGAITLGDLLSNVPGVYVARAGFLGQPEYAMYAGRGPAGLEVYLDGFRLAPVGGDSIYFDPSTVKIAQLYRVDVEILPSRLRVYLVSERHDTLEPRSYLRVMSGAFSTAQYSGLFQRRWSSGFALDLGADFTGSDGEPQANRSDQLLDVTARLRWMPSPRVGAAYQIRRQNQEREALGPGAAFSPPARKGDRTESIFRFFAANRADGLGLRAEGGLGTTTWADSINPTQTITQAWATVRYVRPSAHLSVEARAADERVLSALRLTGSWVPMSGIVLSGEAGRAVHPGDRTTRDAMATVGLYAGPFSLVGFMGYRNGVQAPALLSDSAQLTSDRGAQFGLTSLPLTGHVALIQRDAYLALPPPDFTPWPAFDSTLAATYVEADVALSAFRALTLSAWYSHPTGTSGSGLQPPKHGRADLTFRSRFLRRFRSGVYDFRLTYRIEFWSRGTAGLDATGSPVTLPGATFHEIFVQIQLVDFKIFWNLRNARNSQAQYVPGLPYPRNAQTFGVQWQFFN